MEGGMVCGECGKRLPSGAPEGLCPACLMRHAFEGGAEASESSSESPTLLEVGVPVPLAGVAENCAVQEMEGRYAWVADYSRGGMGRILVVHDQSVGRNVALKELIEPAETGSRDTPASHSVDAVARFLREARLAGQLEHPGIVPVYEVGRRENGTFYYTMKLVRGKTLRGVLRETRSLGGRMKLLPHVLDLCQAVAYAHSRGVIHRDIKPDNVMVGEFGETVVIDWGIAKVRGGRDEPESSTREPLPDFDDPVAAARTENGIVLGTPAYMPPEQAAGDLARVDERSDVYALGAVLYEVLTGRPPFSGGTTRDLLRKVRTERPQPVRSIERRVPRELARVCEKALARDPEDRFASAGALAQALQTFVSGRLFSGHEARQSFLMLFHTFGAALIATGLGMLAYFHREQIPPWAGLLLLSAVVAALLGIGAQFSGRRGYYRLGEFLMLLGTLSVGGLLFLGGAWYGVGWLSLHRPFAWGLWAALALSAACVTRGFWPMGVAALASLVAFLLHASNAQALTFWWSYPILAAAVLFPFAYYRESKTLFFLSLCVTAVSTPLCAVSTGNLWFVWCSLIGLCLLYFPWGLLSRNSERYRKFALPATGLSVALMALLIALLSAQGARDFYASAWPAWVPRNHDYTGLIPMAVTLVAAALMWGRAVTRKETWPELRLLARIVPVCALLEVAGITLGMSGLPREGAAGTLVHWGAFLLIDLAALLLGGFIAWTGVLIENRRVFLSGCLFLVAITLFRMYAADLSMEGKAITMVPLGAAVIAAGLKFGARLKRKGLL